MLPTPPVARIYSENTRRADAQEKAHFKGLSEASKTQEARAYIIPRNQAPRESGGKRLGSVFILGMTRKDFRALLLQ